VLSVGAAVVAVATRTTSAYRAQRMMTFGKPQLMAKNSLPGTTLRCLVATVECVQLVGGVKSQHGWQVYPLQYSEYTSERDRRSLDILSVKKEAKLSASETPGAEEGKGEEDLPWSYWSRLFARPFGVVRRRRDKVGVVVFLGSED